MLITVIRSNVRSNLFLIGMSSTWLIQAANDPNRIILGDKCHRFSGWMWVDHPSGFFRNLWPPKSSMSWVSNGFNTSLLSDGYGFPLFKLPTESQIIYSLYIYILIICLLVNVAYIVVNNSCLYRG